MLGWVNVGSHTVECCQTVEWNFMEFHAKVRRMLVSFKENCILSPVSGSLLAVGQFCSEPTCISFSPPKETQLDPLTLFVPGC